MSAVENNKFGDTLKAARESKKISLAHIAETLKLTIDIIENIEASNTAVLPPAAFTCGYIRSFSKLVGIDEDEVVRLYNQSIGVELVDAVPRATSDLPAQVSSNDLSMRIASYSFILVAIVLLFVWFQSTRDETELPVVALNNNEIVADPVAINNNEIVTDLAAEENNLTVADETQVKEHLPVIVATPAVESDLIVSDTDVTEIKHTEAKESVPSEEADPEEIKKDKVIALSKKANPVASVGSDVVVLTANDDCWVEISDANDQLLYFSLLKKGEEVQLQGQEPFNVFLGKAKAVVIVLNDIQYDASRYVRSNQIARFTMSMDNLLENQVKQDLIDKQNTN
ncbi:MAG: DUF4115 domain-containing protein [Gammaproteobacteria bacterium]|nr:DUF4115 domain-containing protein [Gammaproteobacteria bacterium]